MDKIHKIKKKIYSKILKEEWMDNIGLHVTYLENIKRDNHDEKRTINNKEHNEYKFEQFYQNK